jgi:hypothetical protein
MKKIFLILFLLPFLCKAQFPVQQSMGSGKTQVYSKGAFGADSGFVHRENFADTSAANRGFLKNIAGAVIRTGDTLWMRNSLATGWIKQVGGLATNLFNSDGQINAATRNIYTTNSTIREKDSAGNSYFKRTWNSEGALKFDSYAWSTSGNKDGEVIWEPGRFWTSVNSYDNDRGITFEVNDSVASFTPFDGGSQIFRIALDKLRVDSLGGFAGNDRMLGVDPQGNFVRLDSLKIDNTHPFVIDGTAFGTHWGDFSFGYDGGGSLKYNGINPYTSQKNELALSPFSSFNKISFNAADSAYIKIESTVDSGYAQHSIKAYKQGGTYKEFIVGVGGIDFKNLSTDNTATQVLGKDASGHSAWVDVSSLGGGGSTISLAAIGSTPNANGATLTSGVLNLQPASGSFGGVVTTGTQTFAGAKTFSSFPTISAATSGRVPYFTTSGLLTDNANFGYDGTTLTLLGTGSSGTVLNIQQVAGGGSGTDAALVFTHAVTSLKFGFWLDNGGANLNVGTTIGGVPIWKMFRSGNMVVNGTNDNGYKTAIYGTGTAGGLLVEKDAEFGQLIKIKEQAAPSTPASTFGYLYLKTDGILYWKDDGGVEHSAGGSSGHYAPLASFYTDVSNSSSTETDLYSHTLAANKLVTNGDKIIAEFFGTFNSPTSAVLKFYFAGAVESFTSIPNNQRWKIHAVVVKTGTTTGRLFVELLGDFDNVVDQIADDVTGVSWTSTNLMKITGQDTSSAKITAKLASVDVVNY